MANHAMAQQHLMNAHQASKAGDARTAKNHAFSAVKALGDDDQNEQGDPNEPDADDADGAANPDTMHGAPMNDGSHFIQGAIKHPGALHRELGVPQGKKIPAKKVEAAAHSSNPTLAKRARFTETLKKINRARKG